MYVRVIVYLFTQETLVVTSGATLIVTAPPQLSPAVTDAVFACGTSEVHVTVVATGHVSVGATLSKTVMVCVHVFVF